MRKILALWILSLLVVPFMISQSLHSAPKRYTIVLKKTITINQYYYLEVEVSIPDGLYRGESSSIYFYGSLDASSGVEICIDEIDWYLEDYDSGYLYPYEYLYDGDTDVYLGSDTVYVPSYADSGAYLSVYVYYTIYYYGSYYDSDYLYDSWYVEIHSRPTINWFLIILIVGIIAVIAVVVVVVVVVSRRSAGW